MTNQLHPAILSLPCVIPSPSLVILSPSRVILSKAKNLIAKLGAGSGINFAFANT